MALGAAHNRFPVGAVLLISVRVMVEYDLTMLVLAVSAEMKHLLDRFAAGGRSIRRCGSRNLRGGRAAAGACGVLATAQNQCCRKDEKGRH